MVSLLIKRIGLKLTRPLSLNELALLKKVWTYAIQDGQILIHPVLAITLHSFTDSLQLTLLLLQLYTGFSKGANSPQY